MINKILRLFTFTILCAAAVLLAAPEDSCIAADITVAGAYLEISDTSVSAYAVCTSSIADTAQVAAAVYNSDNSLHSVYYDRVKLISGKNSFEYNFVGFDYTKGMYAALYVWKDMNPLCKPRNFRLPNELKYGSVTIEAEDIMAEKPTHGIPISDSDASGGRAAYFTAHRWDTAAARPSSDGSDDTLYTEIDVESHSYAGDYVLWYRYKLMSSAQGSFIWYRYGDAAYARKHASQIIDGTYRWASINITLKEGINELAFNSGVPSYIDRFIITSNFNFKPVGVDDFPVFVTDEILESQWSKLWALPPVAPPKGHPRLYVTPGSMDEFKARLNSSENGWMYNKFKTRYAYEALDCTLDTALSNNYNSLTLVKIMSRALVYVVGDETDINHAKQTISYMRDFLDTVRTPDDTGDITRIRGDIMVAAAVVYDWCYDALTDDDKEYFKDKFVTIAASKEIGWPPDNMSSVASHGGEQEIFRDLLAAGIAIYDEYPIYYNLAAGRMFEEMIPAREWLRASGRFDPGNDYAECRGYSEMWAGMTLKRMGCDESIYGACTAVPLRWLIHNRMPYGAMMPSGDMYTLTRTESAYYHRNYMLTYLLGANLYGDPVLKQEFRRRFDLAYAGEEVQFWYTVFNDTDIGTDTCYDEPLAKVCDYPLSAISHKTNYQEGYDADTAFAFMNMHEVFVGDHQNIYTGDFQIYYKGLLAMNTGTYNASTQHNEGYKRRAIAGNTMLCYDPDETFVPTWSTVTVPNDGGQRTPYLDENGRSKGSVVGKLDEFEIDSDGIARNKDLVVAEDVHKYVGPNKHTPLYSYISGELTNAYSDKVEYYKRSMVFADLANDIYPAAFIVYDRMKSADASFKKTWLMHSQQKPEITDNIITIKRTDEDFDGKLTDRVLLPEAHNIEVIGGDNNEMFTVGGLLMAPKANTIEGGNYRIELSPRNENLEDEFLNVMYVSDASGNAPELRSTKVETELFVGASVYDRIVLFAKNDIVNTSFRLTVNSDFDKTYVLICDVAEGTWNISGNSESINVSSAYGENVIFAELADGTYTFTPTTASASSITYPEREVNNPGDFVIWKYTSHIDGNGSLEGNFIYQVKPTILRAGVQCVPSELMEQFGADVTYSGNRVTVTKDGKSAVIDVNVGTVAIGGVEISPLCTPFISEGAVYVAIKDFSGLLGYDFSYKTYSHMLTANIKS